MKYIITDESVIKTEKPAFWNEENDYVSAENPKDVIANSKHSKLFNCREDPVFRKKGIVQTLRENNIDVKKISEVKQ